jgi:hypothetical protein
MNVENEDEKNVAIKTDENNIVFIYRLWPGPITKSSLISDQVLAVL